jgi:hypothetical protein
MAEDRADVDDAVARGYAGPLARLVGMRALPPGSVLAHGVHLTPEQVALTERLGCWIVQNPRSNRSNGVGFPAALVNSRRVALGTDGFVSDMRTEAAVLLEDSERHGEDSTAARSRPDAGHALVTELFGEANDACELAAEGGVRHLTIAGRAVVRDGQLLTGDLEEIRRQAREAAPHLWRRMEEMT